MGNLLRRMGSAQSQHPDELVPKSTNNNKLQQKIQKGSQSYILPENMKKMTTLLSSGPELSKKFYPRKEICEKQPTLKIKLCIIKIEEYDSLMYHVAANLSNIFNVMEYGLIHSSVLVGNWVLHWFNDSLVHFHPFLSSKCIIALDVGTLDAQNDYAKLEKINRLVAHYNQDKKYHQLKCNCQHFTRDILDILGIEAHFPGQLGEFMDNLRKSNKFKKVFTHPLTKEKTEFKTHKELDMYVHKLLKDIPTIKTAEEYAAEWALLKAFDRSFWMSLYHYNEKLESGQEISENIEDLKEYRCVFKDPYESKTLVAYGSM